MINTAGYRKDISTEDIMTRIDNGESIYSIAKSYDVSIPTIKYRINKARKIEEYMKENSIEQVGFIIAGEELWRMISSKIGEYVETSVFENIIVKIKDKPNLTCVVAENSCTAMAVAASMLVFKYNVDRIKSDYKWDGLEACYMLNTRLDVLDDNDKPTEVNEEHAIKVAKFIMDGGNA